MKLFYLVFKVLLRTSSDFSNHVFGTNNQWLGCNSAPVVSKCSFSSFYPCFGSIKAVWCVWFNVAFLLISGVVAVIKSFFINLSPDTSHVGS